MRWKGAPPSPTPISELFLLSYFIIAVICAVALVSSTGHGFRTSNGSTLQPIAYQYLRLYIVRTTLFLERTRNHTALCFMVKLHPGWRPKMIGLDRYTRMTLRRCLSMRLDDNCAIKLVPHILLLYLQDNDIPDKSRCDRASDFVCAHHMLTLSTKCSALVNQI